jgi:hypothetical protein
LKRDWKSIVKTPTFRSAMNFTDKEEINMKSVFPILSILITMLGATTSPVWAANRVLSLDGDGDWVAVDHSETLATIAKAMTIEVWVKPTMVASGRSQSLVDKAVGGSPPWGENAFGLSIRLPNRFAVVLEAIGGRIELVGGYAVPNIWHHLAATFQDGEQEFYLNGILIDSNQSFSGPLKMSDAPLVIGSAFAYEHLAMLGQMDEIRMWNIVRTQEEIQATMGRTLKGDERGLVGYWNFDDGTANDLSKHRNDGALLGDAEIVEAPSMDEFIPGEVTSLVLDDQIANPGETFSTYISIRFAEALHRFSFDLKFDPSVLQAVGVEEGSFLGRSGADSTSWETPKVDNEKGIITHIKCLRTGKRSVSENRGVLAVVTFTARKVGSSGMRLQNLRLSAPNGEEISVRATAGSATIFSHGSISGLVIDAESTTPIPGALIAVSNKCLDKITSIFSMVQAPSF